jgi:uroporphyrinogen decarboxylase
MTDRERFVDCVLGEPVDRPPFLLFWSPWGRAWQRWEREGKPPEITDFRSFANPDTPPLVVPVNCGPCPPIAPRVIAEDEDSVTHTDSWGIVRRDLKRNESMSQFLRFPVSDRRDWEEFRERYLDPDHPDRLAGPWREHGRAWMDAGLPIQLGYFPDVGIFGSVRWLLGDEECLIAFMAEPDLVHEIMDHMTSVYLTVFEAVAREVRVDVIHIWEDMCGCQGPLISPRHWREFMGPCYRRIRAFMDRHGIPVLSVDTDGNPNDIVPCMMEAGVNYLWPMEVAAGADVCDYRRRFPELALMGGIDKRALAVDRRAIDAELHRVWPAVESGRYIPDLDHLVPDDVSWENYHYYALELRRRVVGE